jgi:hypothetical protein
MKLRYRTPSCDQQRLLEGASVLLLESEQEYQRMQQLLEAHHYLGGVAPVGERLVYAVLGPDGDWLGGMIFCAAARRLRHRDKWIGWSEEQRRRRLPLVVNNSRFLLLPHKSVPNLASRCLRLALGRLSLDWQRRYGHPVIVVETFVDPEQFCGTLYTASGWVELGETEGCGRVSRDYYQRHERPKRLFARELCHNARRSLQAEHLRPALAAVEARTPPRCTAPVSALRPLAEHFKSVPDYRSRIGSYPLWSLLSIVACAHLADAPRGQKDLAKFAAGLNQGQRAALGIRRHRQSGRYPSPSQPTFHRLLTRVDPLEIERVALSFQRQVRGEPPAEELIAIDGKQPKHTRGHRVLSAVTVPGQHYLGSAMVGEKTNEIPVARELFQRLDLDGRLVSLDALHTQDDTARALVLEHGADYLLTVKSNQATVEQNIERLVEAPPSGSFPPSGHHAHPGPDPRDQQRPARDPQHLHSGNHA